MDATTSLIQVLALTARSALTGGRVNPNKLYPYLTPTGYPPVPGLTESLGHEISVNFVEDLGNLVSGITAAKMDRFSSIEIRESARRNLDARVADGTVEMRVYEGPAGRPVIVSSGHWLSAASILWSGLFQAAGENLKSGDLLASIPHRDALLVFPNGPFEYRQAMREFVKEHESEGRKPLTWELFRVIDSGISAFIEND